MPRDLTMVRQARSFQIRPNKSRDTSLVSPMSWNTVRQKRAAKVRLPSRKSSFDKQESGREAPDPTQFCFTTDDIEDSTTSSLLKEKRARANKRCQTTPNALLPQSRTLQDDADERSVEKQLSGAVDVQHETLKNVGRHPAPIQTAFPAVPLSRVKSMQHRSTETKSRWSPRSLRLRHVPTERSILIIRKTILPKTDEESCLGAEEMESFECIKTYAKISAPERKRSPRMRRSVLFTSPGAEAVYETPSSVPTSSASPRQLTASWSLLSRNSRGTLSPSLNSKAGGRRLGPIERFLSSLKSGRRPKSNPKDKRSSTFHTPTGSKRESSSKYEQPSLCDSSVQSKFSSTDKQPLEPGIPIAVLELSEDGESPFAVEASRNDTVTTRSEDDWRECTSAESSPSMSDDDSVSSSDSSFSSDDEDDDDEEDYDEDEESDEESCSIASNSTMSTRDSIVSKQWNGAVHFSRSYLDVTTEYDL